ncbi:MAG: hypothetical protein JEZ00_18530 [Anaerolineaceae bacterium]|nr:hypothetical protein [Anaerolineaceae bacterium]
MKRLYRNYIKKIVLLGGIIILLAGCNLPSTNPEPQAGEMSLIMTAAAETASAQLTEVSVSGLVQELTNQAATPYVLVTATPQSSSVLATATIITEYTTATAVPCYKVKFVKDVTIPDGTEMEASEAFTKTWQLQNVGSCTWQSNTQLVFMSGNAMNSLISTNIGQTVAPGQVADISIELNAPDSEGTFTGNYQLRSPDGIRFGLGNNADVSFWVKIEVINVNYEMDASHPLDFDYNICAAKWTSGSGKVSCSSSSVNYNSGSARKSSSPKLEGGYLDDEGTIIVSPSSGSSGMIMGQYPEIEIESGDHFKAMIGCMNDRDDCDVLFKLQYLDTSDTLHTLDSWSETYDGSFSHVDVDLSTLDGKKIRLILKVENNGDSKEDEVFWLSAEIDR